ncbi:MAG: ABC transporter permease, partial [Gemmatimonadaceae bacterium]
MTLLLDLRHTARSLRRAPGVVAIAVLSIALGVGANTLVFSWMDNLVLHPFPALRAPDRLVGIETAFPTGDGGPVSFPAFLEWREGSRAFSGMAAWSLARVSARRAGENGSTSLIAMLTSGDYFDVLGGIPHIGRTPASEDERARAPVAVLGYEAWRREFGADTATIGRVVHLNGAPFTVVGVAPPKFVGTYLGVVPDLFVPVTLQPLLTGVKQLEDRKARSFQVVARLADEATLGTAQRELDALARRLSESHGERPILGATVTEARMRYLGGLVSPLFSATLVVTGILLLVACANVAGLLLVRATARSAEMSLRLAVGAARSDLWRLALLESGILAVAGSGLGVLLAYAGRGVVSWFIPTTTFPITLPIEINGRVLGFAIGVAVVASLLCALIPALRSSGSAPGAVLKGASQTLAPSASRLRLGIVASQLAFSLVCLITAALFVRSLRQAGDLDLGFSAPARVLLVNTDLAPAQAPDSARAVILRDVLRRVRALPGVEHASAATFVPLGFGGRRVSPVRVDGYTTRPDEDMSVIVIRAADDYAATMGITVVTGRDVATQDRTDTEPIALVNEIFARRWLGTTSPVGRRIDLGRGWATVAGVLRDGKYGTLTERPQPVVYVPI